MRCGADIGWMRLSALRSPLYEPGANLKSFVVVVYANLGRRVRRENEFAYPPPLSRGGMKIAPAK